MKSQRAIYDEDHNILYDRFHLYNTFMYDKITKSFFLADTHIGLEEYYFTKGINLPRTQLKDILTRLNSAFDYFKNFEIKQIVVLGDVKHEFGKISKQEWFDTLALLDFLLKKAKVILIKGNHDTILGPISDKRGISIYDNYELEDLFFVHGHRLYEKPKDAKYVILGHQHPAISLRKNGRVEKLKCFLFDESHIILPSSQSITTGTDILKEDIISPYIKNIEKYHVVVISNVLFYFHTVSDIQRLIRD